MTVPLLQTLGLDVKIEGLKLDVNKTNLMNVTV